MERLREVVMWAIPRVGDGGGARRQRENEAGGMKEDNAGRLGHGKRVVKELGESDLGVSTAGEWEGPGRGRREACQVEGWT